MFFPASAPALTKRFDMLDPSDAHAEFPTTYAADLDDSLVATYRPQAAPFQPYGYASSGNYGVPAGGFQEAPISNDKMFGHGSVPQELEHDFGPVQELGSSSYPDTFQLNFKYYSNIPQPSLLVVSAGSDMHQQTPHYDMQYTPTQPEFSRHELRQDFRPDFRPDFPARNPQLDYRHEFSSHRQNPTEYNPYVGQPMAEAYAPLSIKRESPEVDYYEPEVSETGKRRYRVIRGVSAGGCSTRPPKQSIESDLVFVPAELSLHGAAVEDICYPQWSAAEKQDRRRIVRIERTQNGPRLTAHFLLVGAANENPVPEPARPDVDVVEVSCLECSVTSGEDYDSQSSDDEGARYVKSEVDGTSHQYYITLVEVVEIVELLIGTRLKEPSERRRERGRVRSNLVPFWSKKPISSRMDSSANYQGYHPMPQTNQDFRVELAKRIMGYEIRKPRGFDKEVRIMRWDKLVPALKRALQSYYTEIPQGDSHLGYS